MWYAVAIAIALLLLVVWSLCAMSARCSREEEKADWESFKVRGGGEG
jgi:hypothetical protein